MRVLIGLENGIEGRSLAWALEHPGCFAYGADGPSAVIAMGQAIPDYIAWMQAHTREPWFQPAGIDIRLEDTWQCYHVGDDLQPLESQDGIEINAWFHRDWLPLTAEDVRRDELLLGWARQDLLALVSGLRGDKLDIKLEGQRWSIRGILRHIARAEWWYLDRLGMAGGPREALPEDVFEALPVVRQRLIASLPDLVGSTQVVGTGGEFWSPRKVVRRAIWHELDHIRHIIQLL